MPSSIRLRILLDTNILIPLQDSMVVLEPHLIEFHKLVNTAGHELLYPICKVGQDSKGQIRPWSGCRGRNALIWLCNGQMLASGKPTIRFNGFMRVDPEAEPKGKGCTGKPLRLSLPRLRNVLPLYRADIVVVHCAHLAFCEQCQLSA